MSAAQFWAVCVGRRRLMASLFGLMVLVVMGAGLLRPPLFTATATLVLDGRSDPLAVNPAPGFGNAYYLATQAGVLRSDRVARRTAGALSADTQAALRARWQAETAGRVEYLTWVVAVLERQQAVRPARDGAVVEVSFTAAEPALAAEFANATVRAYMDVALELSVEPARQYARFFEDRAKAARLALEDAQQRLLVFQTAKGIVINSDRLGVEDARLAELSSQLTVLQAAASDSASREAHARSPQADRLQEVLAHPAINQIKADQGRAEAQLLQLSTRLGDRHPQVLELRAQLVDMQARLEAETRRVAGGVGLSDRINRQRVAALRVALDAQQGTVLRLKAVRDEALVLQREVEQAQRAYDAVLQRLTQSALESENTRVQASLLSMAQPPLEPSSPPLLLRLALALMLGAVLAAGVALLLEWRSRRVRCVQDVVDTLQLPLLMSMPRLNNLGA